jgi:hypothetical protein
MMTVAIPAWNPQGLLPPVDPIDPASPERSPYRVALLDVVARFATSPQRRQILRGWLSYRAALHGMGLTGGFQWLDGSFLEQVEMRENRSPKDMDVVTFLNVPEGFAPSPRQIAVLDNEAAKRAYRIDGYFVELNLPNDQLVRRSAYWYSLWSHRRDHAWKGYLEADLNPAADQQALDYLNQQDAWGAQP